MKTYKQIRDFVNGAAFYLQQKESKAKGNTKFTYALQKMSKQMERHIETFKERVEDIDVELAAVDKDQNVLRDDRGFIFKKPDLVNRTKKVRELLKEEVEVKPYLAASVPEDLEFTLQNLFEGFVLPEQSDEPLEFPAAVSRAN